MTAGRPRLPLLTWGAGLTLFGTLELVESFVSRRRRRREMYARAEEEARRVGLPLLVVGDPDTGFVTRHFGRDYPCGDLCTDVTGCPRCPAGVPGRLEDVLPQMRDRSHVIYVSCTLEYVDDLPSVIRHLERVSGGRVFVVRVPPGNATFWLHPGAKWVLDSAPPSGRWSFRRYEGVGW